MASTENLSDAQKDLVRRLFAAVVTAASPDDPTGHLPNCGYTSESENCGCSEYGARLHKAIVHEVGKQ